MSGLGDLFDLASSDEAAAARAIVDDKERQLTEERERIFIGVLNGEEQTLEQRVALILNHYPETRDSDLRLQMAFWRVYDGWNGSPISETQLFEYTRYPSVSRARARIQNQLGLFQASRDVKQRRGTLDDDEREKAKDAPVRAPSLVAFVDESGKTDANLIVGGVFFSVSSDVFGLQKAILKWREDRSFNAEIHFKNTNDLSEPLFREVIDLTLATVSSISFKAVRTPRRGISDISAAIDNLLYLLLIDGIDHEHETGRAPLPRVLEVWKDEDAATADAIRLASVRDRVRQAGEATYSGRLTAGEFRTVTSKAYGAMQIADLFVSALGRAINTPSAEPKAKDRLAAYILQVVGMPNGPTSVNIAGDAVRTLAI